MTRFPLSFPEACYVTKFPTDGSKDTTHTHTSTANHRHYAFICYTRRQHVCTLCLLRGKCRKCSLRQGTALEGALRSLQRHPWRRWRLLPPAAPVGNTADASSHTCADAAIGKFSKSDCRVKGFMLSYV